MALVINTNFAASHAARQLEKNNTNLMNSLNKLSSGQRIVRPQDDAGGNAVQLKLKASVNRASVAKNNIQNAISILQTQDGIFQTATEVVGRIAELKTMSEDATKNSQDKQNYNEEYLVLRQQLIDLQSEQFNGVSMFTTINSTQGATNPNTAGVYRIYTTEQGSAASAPSVTIEGVYLTNTSGSAATGFASISYAVSGGFSNAVGSGGTQGGIASTGFSMDSILSDLQNLSNARAKNGALQSRMEFAYNNASVGKVNLEAARGRIVDLDIAEESTNFAKANIMAQAAASILSQANATSRSALNLLMG